MQNDENKKDFYDQIDSLLQQVNDSLIEYVESKLEDENTEQIDIIMDLFNFKTLIENMTMLYQDVEDVPDSEDDSASSSDG